MAFFIATHFVCSIIRVCAVVMNVSIILTHAYVNNISPVHFVVIDNFDHPINHVFSN